MAKNTKGKVIQMLSPENYIRKKARTLPIFECLVKSEWEETKMTPVLVARSHSNGNITVCSYLVDLMCLGVKDTMFLFNVPIHTYEEFKEKMTGGIELVEVDYTLAHNIVFAGIEFAEEFGFKPHKDYESITKFMLEEDTEDIELLEIECGRNGKPFYMQGPFEDVSKTQKIIAQLEKTAGKGNYEFVTELDDDEDEFDNMSTKEKTDEFLDLLSNLDTLDEDDSYRLTELTDSFFQKLIDNEMVDQYTDEIFDELTSKDLTDDEIPEQLLGIEPGSMVLTNELKNQFIDLYNLAAEDLKKARTAMQLFRKKNKDIPGICFLDLTMLQLEESEDYSEKLRQYANENPTYSVIQLQWLIDQILSDSEIEGLPEQADKLDSFFTGRESLHPIEFFNYLTFYSFLLKKENNPTKLEAFNFILDDLKLSENELGILQANIDLFKVNFVVESINKVLD